MGAAPPTAAAGDTAWLLVSTALVMLMVPGLALFYGGLVRGKSVLNTMMMSVAALALVSVQWVIGGYSLAFAGEGGAVGTLAWRFLDGVGAVPNATYAATVPHVLFAHTRRCSPASPWRSSRARWSSGCGSARTCCSRPSGRRSCTTRSRTGCGAPAAG
jgi:hypothetical protein